MARLHDVAEDEQALALWVPTVDATLLQMEAARLQHEVRMRSLCTGPMKGRQERPRQSATSCSCSTHPGCRTHSLLPARPAHIGWEPRQAQPKALEPRPTPWDPTGGTGRCLLRRGALPGCCRPPAAGRRRCPAQRRPLPPTLPLFCRCRQTLISDSSSNMPTYDIPALV